MSTDRESHAKPVAIGSAVLVAGTWLFLGFHGVEGLVVGTVVGSAVTIATAVNHGITRVKR